MTHSTTKTIASVLLPVGASDGWIKVFPAGTTVGKDGRGPYHLSDAKAVVAASLRPLVQMAVDRDHVTDVAAPGVERRAAGWVKALEAREDGSVWAQVEWTPPALEQLKNKEYRYISPTFWHTKQGQVTRIDRISLTNDPNFEMPAVASARNTFLTNQSENNMEDLKAQLIALLGLAAAEGSSAVSDDAIIAAVTTLKGSVDAVKEAVDAPADAATPEAIVEAVDGYIAGEIKKEVASKMKASAKATASATRPDPTKYVPIEEVQALQERVAAVEGETSLAKATASVDAAIAAGKVTPGNKDWALDYAQKDPQGFAKYVKGAVVVGGATKLATASAEAVQAGLDDVQMSVANQLGVSAQDFKATAKKLSQA